MSKRIILSTLATTSLLFAAAPTIGDIVRETVPVQDIAPKSEPLIDIAGTENYAPAMIDDRSGKTIKVKAFKITGAVNMEESMLQALIASYADKELTFGQLQEAASLITKAYRNHGYFVARAYIPIQKTHDGIVNIAIIEGRYADVKLTNSSLVNDDFLQAVLDEAKKENIVSTGTLERSLLIINDTPGAKVLKADIMAGKITGSSDLMIQTVPSDRYDGYIIGDNYGSRYTGKNRLMAGINLNSLSGIGDQLSISGLISNGADLKHTKIGYSIPLMSNGLRGELGYSATDYHLNDRYTPLDANGKARSFEASLSYPIIYTRGESLKLSSSIASKNMTDYQLGSVATDKEITVITVGATHTKRQKLLGLTAQTHAGAIISAGNLKFIDDTSAVSDAAGVNTQGRYNKISGYAGATVALAKETLLDTTVKFQKALGNKNLDGSEDFSIGGNSGVKAYPYSESSAENGITFNAELFQGLPPFNKIHQKVGLFYDIGKVSMEESGQTATFQSRTLQDIGLGYYASYDHFFLKMQMARIIGGGNITSEPDDASKFLAQMGWKF